MATRSQSSFQTVKTEGALLPADLLKRVSDGDKEVEGLSPESYHLDPADKINEATNRAWIAVLSPETFWTFLREFSPLCPIEEGSLAVKVGARAWPFRAGAVLRHSDQMPARISLR